MDLVVVAQYSFAHEARIAKASLEAAGIEAYIRDENLVQMNWLYSNAVGGVKLQVAPEDVPDALKILATDYSEALEEEFPFEADEEISCPQCGSTHVKHVVQGKEMAFLSIVALGAPLTPFSRSYQCAACGHEWKVE